MTSFKTTTYLFIDYLHQICFRFHFGQVSTARAVMYAKKHSKAAGVAAFVEETLVRGELSDNFCYYNDNYDKVTIFINLLFFYHREFSIYG